MNLETNFVFGSTASQGVTTRVLFATRVHFSFLRNLPGESKEAGVPHIASAFTRARRLAKRLAFFCSCIPEFVVEGSIGVPGMAGGAFRTQPKSFVLFLLFR